MILSRKQRLWKAPKYFSERRGSWGIFRQAGFLLNRISAHRTPAAGESQRKNPSLKPEKQENPE